MKRMTYFDNGHWRLKWKGCEYSAEFVNRLAAYENTGLEPKEIKELCTDDVAEIAKILRKMIESGEIDHLCELLQAENDGRLVMLPTEDYTFTIRGDLALDIIRANCRDARRETETALKGGDEE